MFLGMGAFWDGLMWPLGICSIGGWPIVSPTPSSLGMGEFWEGLMWPLGICSIGGWLIVSPTHFEHRRVPGPWFALPHLCPPLIHSPNPPQQVSAIHLLASILAMVGFVPIFT